MDTVPHHPAPAPIHIVVVGGGAIGGTLAYHLLGAGHRVTVVERDDEQRRAMRSVGLSLVRDRSTRARRRPQAVIEPVEDAPEGGFQHVLLAVKSQDTDQAADWIAPRLADDGYVVSCQNGDNVTKIAKRVGAHRVIGAFVDIAADVVGHAIIKDGGVTRLVVGELNGRISPRVENLQSILPHIIEPTTDVAGCVWGKRVLAAIYTATALADADTADLIDQHRDVMLAVAREVLSVAALAGAEPASLGYFDPSELKPDASDTDAAFNRLVHWQHSLTKKRVGPFRDISIRRRRTEAHTEIGALLAVASASGLATPTLRCLDQLLEDLETGTRTFGESNFDALRAASAISRREASNVTPTSSESGAN